MILNKERYLCVLDDIYIYHGDTKEFKISVFDELNKEVVLDTVTVKFILCEIDEESIIHLEKTGVNNMKENVSNIKLTSSDTVCIPMNKYTYKIERQYNAGDKNIGKGYFTVM